MGWDGTLGSLGTEGKNVGVGKEIGDEVDGKEFGGVMASLF